MYETLQKINIKSDNENKAKVHEKIILLPTFKNETKLFQIPYAKSV